MLERCCENGIYYSGAAVGFYSGNIRDLSSDLKALKPTIMAAVPRLLNRVYDKDQAILQRSAIRRMLHNMAMKSKEGELKRGILRKNSIWDRLVFKKTQDCKWWWAGGPFIPALLNSIVSHFILSFPAFGGNIRLVLVGSAPLSPKVLDYTRCALGCPIVEGYGQTECCAPISLSVPGDCVSGHVGPPVACCCVKVK